MKIQNDTNYNIIGLYSDNKTQKTLLIHRLVALAFIPNPHNKPCVNHKDGNKLNNNIGNLEWNTHSENTKHACENKLILPTHGEISGMSKLTNSQVLEIRKIGRNMTQKELGEIYDVRPQTISKIILRKAWTHI